MIARSAVESGKCATSEPFGCVNQLTVTPPLRGLLATLLVAVSMTLAILLIVFFTDIGKGSPPRIQIVHLGSIADDTHPSSLSNKFAAHNGTTSITTTFPVTPATVGPDAGDGGSGSNGTDPIPSSRHLEKFSDETLTLIDIVYSLTALCALTGNATVVFVLASGERSSPELRKYLMNLALADILMALFSIPFTYSDFVRDEWIFPPFLCPLVQFIQIAAVFASVMTLVLIGIDRFLAIMYPLRSTRWIRVYWRYLLAAVWLVGAALGVPQYTHSEARLSTHKETGVEYYNCTDDWDSYDAYLSSIVLFAVTYGIPVISLSIFYGTISCKIAAATLPGNRSADQDETRRQIRIKVVKMLIAVVLLFTFAWLPLQIFNLIFTFHSALLVDLVYSYGNKVYMSIFLASHWLAMAHSCVNPIIYCFMSDTFRADLRDVSRKYWVGIRERLRRVGRWSSDLPSSSFTSATQAGRNSFEWAHGGPRRRALRTRSRGESGGVGGIVPGIALGTHSPPPGDSSLVVGGGGGRGDRSPRDYHPVTPAQYGTDDDGGGGSGVSSSSASRSANSQHPNAVVSKGKNCLNRPSSSVSKGSKVSREAVDNRSVSTHSHPESVVLLTGGMNGTAAMGTSLSMPLDGNHFCMTFTQGRTVETRL